MVFSEACKVIRYSVQDTNLKSMFSEGLVYKNRAYFETSGPKWSKLGSFVNKHYILHVIDLIFG